MFFPSWIRSLKFASSPGRIDLSRLASGRRPMSRKLLLEPLEDRTLLSVIVPQAWPAITAVCLFHFFFAWNDFLSPLVYLVGHEELWPISVGMSFFSTQYQQLPHLIQATAVMALALPVAVFVLAQRVFVHVSFNELPPGIAYSAGELDTKIKEKAQQLQDELRRLTATSETR